MGYARRSVSITAPMMQVKGPHRSFLEVGGGGYPLEFVPEFLEGVRETLDVTRTVIEEVETHGW